MDIYSYLRSRAVAEHCRKIGKIWNTCEMAVIISRSDRNIAEKHAAWQELIDCYPDMPSIPNSQKIHFQSIHHRLAEIMDYERRLIARFKTPQEGNYYRYILHFSKEGDYHSRSFTSFEGAAASLKAEWRQDETAKIRFEKIALDSADEYDGKIDALTDYDGNIYHIFASASGKTHKSWFPDVEEVLWEYALDEMFFIDIPLPFKRGDLLTCGSFCPKVFVLDSDCAANPERYAKFMRGEIGDGGDMISWGFFVEGVATLVGDHTGPYDCFEYYTGKLEGDERLLHYVSLFIKGEIGLPELLTMEGRILAEHLLNESFSIQAHGCYIPDSLLAENRGISPV